MSAENVLLLESDIEDLKTARSNICSTVKKLSESLVSTYETTGLTVEIEESLAANVRILSNIASIIEYDMMNRKRAGKF